MKFLNLNHKVQYKVYFKLHYIKKRMWARRCEVCEAFSAFAQGKQLSSVINGPTCLDSTFIVWCVCAAEARRKFREPSCHIPSIPEVSAPHSFQTCQQKELTEQANKWSRVLDWVSMQMTNRFLEARDWQETFEYTQVEQTQNFWPKTATCENVSERKVTERAKEWMNNR